MLCSRCKNLPRASTAGGSGEHWPQNLPGWERLKFILCASCGELLPGAEIRDTVEKLSSLARFGLAAGTSTLTEP